MHWLPTEYNSSGFFDTQLNPQLNLLQFDRRMCWATPFSTCGFLLGLFGVAVLEWHFAVMGIEQRSAAQRQTP